MAVKYIAETKTFILETKNSSYLMAVSRYGNLLHMYYGDRIPDTDLDYLLTFHDRGFSPNPNEAGNDRTFSLDFLPQEFSTSRGGDYRSPSVELVWGEGGASFLGRVAGYEILEGAEKVFGMPSLWASAGEQVNTLEITLEDPVSQAEVKLSYVVFEDKDVVARSVRLINRGEKAIRLERLMSATVDFRGSDYDMIYFTGRHAMEREFQRIPVWDGIHSIGSGRGSSSHQYNPFAIICEKGCGEDEGQCWGFSLIYSGNFTIEAEKDQYQNLRVHTGISSRYFSFLLEAGEEFQTPQAVLAWSGKGLTGLSHIYHRIFRENLCRSPFRKKPRPILLNSWEAAYFDFDGEKILQIAREAAGLGVELFVLDDGWFGKRDNDSAGLGDWTVNRDKLKMDLKDMSDRIHEMGLQFGIWVEPEMVSEASSRLVPEGSGTPGRPRPLPACAGSFQTGCVRLSDRNLKRDCGTGENRVREMGCEPQHRRGMVRAPGQEAPGGGPPPVHAWPVLRDGSGDLKTSGGDFLRMQRRRRPVRPGHALLPAADLVQRQHGRRQPVKDPVRNLLCVSDEHHGSPCFGMPQPYDRAERALCHQRNRGHGRDLWI